MIHVPTRSELVQRSARTARDAHHSGAGQRMMHARGPFSAIPEIPEGGEEWGRGMKKVARASSCSCSLRLLLFPLVRLLLVLRLCLLVLLPQVLSAANGIHASASNGKNART